MGKIAEVVASLPLSKAAWMKRLYGRKLEVIVEECLEANTTEEAASLVSG